MATPVVGFVGLGAMGLAMAERIVRAGFPLLAYNRTPGRGGALLELGAEFADTPADVARRADIVCGCLLDGSAVEQVYLGRGGMALASRAGQVFVEHGTFDPVVAGAVTEALRSRGASFVDAPVTGGPEGARAGSLTAMAGGDVDAIERAAGVISCYAARIRRIGPGGSGLRLKLVNQMLVSCHVVAAAEALAVLRRLDIALPDAADVLTSGWAAGAMLQRAFDRSGESAAEPSGATIAGLIEPQMLARALGEAAGLRLSLLESAATQFQAAQRVGLGQRDLAAFFTAVEALSEGQAED